jgi:putative ATP-dependent endonuclease of the OLD family
MKLKKLEIDGFRCLVNFKISFEDDLTVIVGENDSGKTSLIECLKVITQNKKIEEDDFYYEADTISLKIEVNDFVFERKYKRNNGLVEEESFVAKPTQIYLDGVKSKIKNSSFDSSVEENIDFIKNTAKVFGIPVRSNSNIEILRENILTKISTNNKGQELIIQNAKFPDFNNIQLSGRQFEDISSFFKEVFLKEKQASIWREKINNETGSTIEDFVKERISSYSSEITKMISEKGILAKIQLFLSNLSEIKIEPLYESKDLNINAKVKFLEGGKEINIEKKGDGTKRRITMALLEFKKEESLSSNDENTIYLLDEPDTHLHVKAQLELLNIMETFTKDGHQVICTTHSPFIINALNPKQIRLLENRNSQSKIKYLKNEADTSNKILKSLGVENTYLFFAKHIILVEGATEEAFIPAYYQRATRKPITSALVKIINVEGINNIPGFSKAILELHNPENIHLLFDNDVSAELLELISCLGIDENRKFLIGDREFEDSFESGILHRCWCAHLDNCQSKHPTNWTIEQIERVRSECLQKSEKFSRQLRKLNAGGKMMTKPIFGKALGEYIQDEEMPEVLLSLFRNIKI